MIRCVVHDNERVLWKIWQQLFCKPFREEAVIHLTVIVPSFASAFEHQLSTREPTLLRYCVDDNQAFAFPGWLVHPRTICI
jgi:hypothetical protein